MWFVETPWPPIAICVAGSIGLFFYWTYSQKHKIYLLASLGMIVAAVGIFFIERQIVTERELIEDSLLGMTSAFKEGDVEKTLTFISHDAENLLRARVGGAMLLYRIDGYLRISDISVRNEEDKTMISRFRASGFISKRIGAGGSRFSTLWEFRWKKNETENRWQIVSIQRFHPISEEEMEFMDPDLN